MSDKREELFVDGVSGIPTQLFAGNEERMDYRLVNGDNVPVDATTVTMSVRASVEPDATPDTFKSLPTYSIVLAPDQTEFGGTRGVFQIIMPAAEHDAGDAPGTIRADILVDGRVRAPWFARLVVSEAVGA